MQGPDSFTITNLSSATTVVKNLAAGLYKFELKVIDNGWLSARDTVQIMVNAAIQCDVSNRPLVATELIPFGTLSTSRTGMTIASAGNKILFAGGNDDDDDDDMSFGSTRVDIYDMVSQSWSIAELSVPRWNLEAITVGNKIFFAGGHTVSSRSWERFSTVDIYDASTNTWSTAQLSERRMDMAGASAGNKVFFAGGLGGQGSSPPSTISNKIDIYDVINNTWSAINLSEGRACLSAVTAANKIYFAGGNTKNGPYTTSYNPSSRVDTYDNTTQTWSRSNMNESLAYRAAINVGDKIFWAGGFSYEGAGSSYRLSSSVEIRDVNTQTSSFSCLFQPNARFKAVTKVNKIIFFTGEGTVKNKFDIYNLTNNTWSIGTLSTSFQNVQTAIISINNTIYVAEHGKAWKLEF